MEVQGTSASLRGPETRLAWGGDPQGHPTKSMEKTRDARRSRLSRMLQGSPTIFSP